MLLAGEQGPSMHPTFPEGLWPHKRAPQPIGAGHHQHGDSTGARAYPGHSHPPLLLPAPPAQSEPNPATGFAF